jgi:alpha-N-arabinofuranosidase
MAAALVAVAVLGAGVLGQQNLYRGCPDPAIIRSHTNGQYYIFSTGRGLPILRSKDLLHWEAVGRVFEKPVPDWAAKEVPGTRGIWAPDISYFNGRYHLYYSVSTFGSQRSCIGLATNTVLDPAEAGYKWVDHGKVIESDAGKTDFNAIDPAAFVDRDGSVYLAWGSYWDGLKMCHIDPKTGRPNPNDSRRYSLARHPQGHVIEAAFIIYREGWYYLFASYDACCDGVKSTYNVRVGRSEKVTGPYVDVMGKRMADGGGTLILAGDERWRGPGHNSVLQTPDGDYIVHHTYDAAEERGGRNLQIRPLIWTGHGWPVPGEPIVDALPEKRAVAARDLVGEWRHSANYGRGRTITLLADGTIAAAGGGGTWALDGDTLFLRWPNPDAPEGAWLDECYVAGNGRSYVGMNQNGIVIRGVREEKAALPEGVNRLVVHADQGKLTIAPEIYGHFAEHLGRCVYEGFWVGEDSEIPNVRGIRTDVVEALKKLRIPVLRWPGGCFADEYHWKDGIGPREKRPRTVNTHWGMVTETNAFGTHEFLDLCEQLGCEAYIAGNVGSGTVEEMADWVEYMTFDGDSEMANLRRANGRDKPWRVRYFGVGNENWGCGGNMTPEYYADLYKRYQTYVRNYSGNRIVKVACGPGDVNYRWMEVLMERAGSRMDAISLHYYVRGTGNWTVKGSATNFDEGEWFALMKNTLDVHELLDRNIEILDRYDPRGRVGLFVDEWGTWWDEEPGTKAGFLYQQNTLRDAVSAGIFLNAFNDHCRRVRMANIAQTNNVLQAMILTRGKEMILTPTYHVFEMYKVHQGATYLPSEMTCNAYEYNSQKIASLSASASRDKDGRVHVTVCNLDPHAPAELVCELSGMTARRITGRVLTAEKMNTHNTFEEPEAVKPRPLRGCEIDGGRVLATLPAKSVVLLTVE